jgi:ERCC4-type nuclease
MSFKLQIDDREHELISHFENEEFQRTRLTIGDIAYFYYDYLVFIIERKTLKDFIASFHDGRLVTQLRNMKNLKQPIYDPKRIIILETEENIPANVQSKLDHLVVRDNFHIIYTTTVKDTAARIKSLCKNCHHIFLSKLFADKKQDPAASTDNKINLIENQPQDTKTNNPPTQETDIKTNPIEIQGGNAHKPIDLTSKLDTSILDETKTCLMSIKGVGNEIATSLLQHYSIVELVKNQDTKELRDMKVGNLNSKKISKTIIKKLSTDETYINILLEIKGIGKKSLEKNPIETIRTLFTSYSDSHLDTMKFNQNIKEKIKSILNFKIPV